MIRLRKRSFGNTVLLQCNRLLSDLLENDNDNDGRKQAQEYIGNHCFDIIRKKGSKEIYDFRKKMIENVLGIVQSDNPIISMRKKLIKQIHSSVHNQTFFFEKFYDRRQELYDDFNRFGNKEFIYSDETVSVIAIWNEAETYILRLLHLGYFEEISKDDWFLNYINSYKLFVEMLYEIRLSKKDEKDFSLNGILFPVLKGWLECYQHKLVGEVVGLTYL